MIFFFQKCPISSYKLESSGNFQILKQRHAFRFEGASIVSVTTVLGRHFVDVTFALSGLVIQTYILLYIVTTTCFQWQMSLLNIWDRYFKIYVENPGLLFSDKCYISLLFNILICQLLLLSLVFNQNIQDDFTLSGFKTFRRKCRQRVSTNIWI